MSVSLITATSSSLKCSFVSTGVPYSSPYYLYATTNALFPSSISASSATLLNGTGPSYTGVVNNLTANTAYYICVYYGYFSTISFANVFGGPFTTLSATPCFKEGTKILTRQGYKKIETLKKGDLLKTINNGFVPIHLIGKKEIYHSASEKRIKDQLYQLSSDKYPNLFEDLVLTGSHSILVDEFVSDVQREKAIEVNGDTFVTDGKYRLPAAADNNAVVYKTAGVYTIYHIALENDNYYNNYGIYANGLLVESCSKRYLTELSGMNLY
jgi:hypothetical protein